MYRCESISSSSLYSILSVYVLSSVYRMKHRKCTVKRIQSHALGDAANSNVCQVCSSAVIS